MRLSKNFQGSRAVNALNQQFTLQMPNTHFLNIFRLQSIPASMNTLRKQHGNLWSYSREPIKSPLLMKLQEYSEKCDKAVQIFVWIMRVNFLKLNLRNFT